MGTHITWARNNELACLFNMFCLMILVYICLDTYTYKDSRFSPYNRNVRPFTTDKFTMIYAKHQKYVKKTNQAVEIRPG